MTEAVAAASARLTGAGPAGGSERRAELTAALGRLRARIARACEAAGRDRSEITLIAITKTYPATDVIMLSSLGVHDIGENRDQEAAPKAAAVAASGVDVRWHFVGRLQRNKCRSVARYASVVHSVDRAEVADALAAGVAQARPDRPLDVLLQVSIDGDTARGGVAVPGLPRLAEQVAGRPELRLRGVMAVAPLGWEPDRAFDVLAEAAARLRVGYPTATVVSAGMSADLEAAIRHGATHVRIGSALLGSRPPVG